MNKNNQLDSFDFTGSGGINLKGYAGLPNSGREPMGLIVIVHGFGEYLMRYDALIQSFLSSGLIVYGMDLRGHGHSEGKRGHAKSFNQFLDDIDELLKIARAEYNDLPVFIYGHSAGGNIALNYLLKRKTRELTAAIITSPWLSLADPPSKMTINFIRVFKRLFPSLQVPFNLEPDQLTSDPEMINQIKQDNMLFRKISLANFDGLNSAGKWAIENAHKLKIPTLLLHGTADTVTSCQSSRQFASKAGDIVIYKTWESGKHELHNDLDRRPVIDLIKNWIFQRINQLGDELNFYN